MQRIEKIEITKMAKSVKDTRQLVHIPVGQSCRIWQLGGAWMILEQNGAKTKVKNNASEVELDLPSTSYLAK